MSDGGWVVCCRMNWVRYAALKAHHTQSAIAYGTPKRTDRA